MAYRLRRKDGSVRAALRRIAKEQIDRALAETEEADDLPQAVHALRKRCKKLRGLIRLVRPAFDDYAGENASFRDAARRVSNLRDADTLIATYDRVAEHFAGQIDRRAFAPIRGRLTREARERREAPQAAELMDEARAALREARERAARWKLDETGFKALSGGLGKTYGRARRQMQAAWADRSDGAMHEWRKRVKYHSYHARLLRQTRPAMMGPHAEAASRLSDLLGEHHDLAVLAARLRDTPGDFGGATDLEAFRALILERKDALADEAFELGRLLLAERRGALVDRWGAYWERWSEAGAEPGLLVRD